MLLWKMEKLFLEKQIFLKKHKKIDRVFLEPNDVQPMEEAIDALREADLIVLGTRVIIYERYF